MFREITIVRVIETVCDNVNSTQADTVCKHIPSMNSLVNILTLRGRDVLERNSFAVTIGYSWSCLDISFGKASSLCCQSLVLPSARSLLLLEA